MTTAPPKTAPAITFRVPAACDLTTIFDQRDADYAAYLLSTIHQHWLKWDFDKSGFVRLTWELLAKFIPDSRLKRIIDTLAGQGVIEVDHSYSEGHYPKGYRWALENCESTEHVCQNKMLANKIRKYWRAEEAKLLPVHRWLASKFTLFTVDHVQAKRIIATLEPDAGSPLTVREYRQLLHERLRQVKGTQQHSLTCDDYGRVHTPLTSLPTELRCCLRVCDQNLVGIDITNSQPLFLGIVARRCITSKQACQRKRKRDFANRVTPYVTQEYQALRTQQLTTKQLGGVGELCSSSNMSSNMSRVCLANTRNHGVSQACQVIPSDLQNYQALCEQGRLYDHLQTNSHDRDTIKKQVFHLFYGENSSHTPFAKRFAQEFPTIDRVLTEWKAEDHRHASHLLQSYESTLVIAIICQRIRRECPAIPLFTIHDSLLTTPPHVDYVEEVMRNEFAQIGIQVPLKKDVYLAEDAA